MGVLGVVGFVTLMVCVFGVGLRLLGAWRRTRHPSELTIGIACLTTTLGGMAMLGTIRLPAGDLAIFPLSAAAQLLLNVGTFAMMLGVWRVFRPRKRWAGFACAVLGLAMFGAWGLLLAAEQVIRQTDSDPANLVLRIGRLVPYVWASAESFSHHGRLRRQLALGLTDAVVASQMRLWGVSAAAMSVILGMAIYCGVFLGKSILTWPPGLLATNALSFVAGIALWLAFFPPAPYRRFVETRSAAVEGTPA